MEKQDGRIVAMVTKDLQTLNLKLDQVMFNPSYAKLFRTHTLYQGGGGHLDPLLFHQHLIV